MCVFCVCVCVCVCVLFCSEGGKVVITRVFQRNNLQGFTACATGDILEPVRAPSKTAEPLQGNNLHYYAGKDEATVLLVPRVPVTGETHARTHTPVSVYSHVHSHLFIQTHAYVTQAYTVLDVNQYTHT